MRVATVKMSRDVPDLQAWWVPWVGGVLVVLVLLYSLYTWHEREERVAMLVEMQTAVQMLHTHLVRYDDFYKRAPANALDWKPEHWKQHAELIFDARLASEHIHALAPQFKTLLKSRFSDEKWAELKKVQSELMSNNQPSKPSTPPNAP